MQKQKSHKKIILLLLTGLLVLFSSTSVFAKEEKGSIQILLTKGDIGTSVENVVFEYTKVAELKNGFYYLDKQYGNIDLNEINTAKELAEAAELISSNVVSANGEVKTDNNGEAIIKDLEIGVYLLEVSDKARYENVTPLLISIPTWNEEAGDMVYDVTVIPKHSPNKPGEIITNTDKGVSSDSPKTGDNANYGLYIALLGASVTLIALSKFKKKTGGANYEE